MSHFGDRPQPFTAIYEHWERNQWSPLDIDFSTDAKSFAALDAEDKESLLWLFAQRFQAEFTVADLLAPFLVAAPDHETRLVLATQVADEFRHVESIRRVYEQVVGLTGGLTAVRKLADECLDPVSSSLYQALDDTVRPLAQNPDEDTFLRTVFAYHVLGEGVVGRTTQSILPAHMTRFGEFPGLLEAQRHAIRDEARHIAFGVAYVRRRVVENRDHAWSVFGHIVEGFRALCEQLLEAEGERIGQSFVHGYGIEPHRLWAEATRQLRLRLRAIGFDQPAETLRRSELGKIPR